MTASTPDPAAIAALDLLREIRRDVAHDLRGPVQSILVNTEVTRRRVAAGDTAGALERIDVLEAEVRRMHETADAFLALLHPLPLERRVFDVASVLDQVEPLFRVLARSARIRFRRVAEGTAPLVRSRPEALALALVRIGHDLGAAAGPQAELTIERLIQPVTVDLVVAVAGPEPPAPLPAAPRPDLAAAVAAARLWIDAGDGTVEHPPGSDPGTPGPIRIRLPRADIA